MSSPEMSLPEQQRQLLLRYLDAQLSPAERDRVDQLLRESADARAFLREVAEHAVVVADLERTEHVRRSAVNTLIARSSIQDAARPDHAEPATQTPTRRIMRGATIALALLAGGLVLWHTTNDSESVRITQFHGAMRWTGDGGQVVREFDVGNLLRDGTVETLSPHSWVEFEFQDGSAMTLTGESIVTISQHRHKELHLRAGSLSARVAPQRAGRSMLIHTPTALVEVLGTRLNIEVHSSATRLSVNEGRVRVTRLVDGSVADVAAEHQIVASVAPGEFRPTRRPVAVNHWESQLAHRPEPEAVHGNWLPPQDGVPPRLQTIPTLINIPGIEPFTLYAAGIGVSRIAPSPVQLESGSRFRVHGRIELAEGVRFGITAHHRNGSCAGKFEAGHAREVPLSTDDQGWFDVEIPLSAFQRLEPDQADSTAGLTLIDFYVYTIDERASLELTGVDLVPPGESR